MRRRDFLGLAGAGALATLLRPVLATTAPPGEFFIFIHAAGGWDVTLWADPRNERKGLIEPAHSGNTDFAGLRHFKQAALDGDLHTFDIVTPANSPFRFGPAIGDLLDLRDRITVINGIAMNTVSHDDGTTFSTTGRHRSGGSVPESSIDVLVASELGTSQLMPNVSVKFPSVFVGQRLDRRAIPLRVASVDSFTKSFVRSDTYLDDTDRIAISTMLADEASELAKASTHASVYEQLASQHTALPSLVTPDFTQAFDPHALQARYPQFNYKGRHHGPRAAVAAFAVEAMQRNLARCIGFALGALDTHDTNYRQHAATLQELFDLVAALVKTLDATPHPTLASAKLSEHTHILIVSEFCRTPQINQRGGRDHYPNNSALVISPRFKAGKVFGKTDAEQLLPGEFGTFSDGKRPIAPPDLLATFLHAFGIDPRRYMRDGEIVKALLM